MTIDLSRPWNECALVVVDFETDGPDQETCMPVELAAVRFEAGNVTARFSTFLNPGRPIDPASTKIHGIDDAMVQGAPTLEQVAGEILKVAVDAVPAAYNSRFDARVLHRFITGKDAPVFDPEQEWLCGFVMAGSEKQDRWVPGKGRLRLTEVAKRHGISVGTAHRAEIGRAHV